MSTLQLNVERVNAGLVYEQRMAGPTLVFEWVVCPCCGWVSREPVGSGAAKLCSRPDDMRLFALFLPGKCGGTERLSELAPRVADALEVALHTGGTNACIELLGSLMFESIGLFQRQVAAKANLDELRPESVAPPKPRRSHGR